MAKKIALVIIAIILGLGLLLFLGAVNMGYFPAVGNVFGIAGAKDLGITYTDDDYASAKEKFEDAASAEAVDQNFTDAELTALVNGCSEAACVINEAQVRTSEDGLLEISGVIDRDEVEALLVESLPDDANLETIETVIRYLPAEPAFYVKGDVSAENDVVLVDLRQAKIAGINFVGSDLNDIEEEIERALMDYLDSMSGTQIESLTITEEGVYLNADFAEIIDDQLEGNE